MKLAAIHLHHRKQSRSAKDPYPHPDPRVRFLDKLILAVAVVFPLSTLPQIFTVWYYHNASGVSLITWSLYFLMTIPLLIYGIVHKEKPLVIMYILWLIVYAGVISGAVMYG
ncbi:hypothetical protein HZB03_00795 [Candidatus Woesearchaeota archaeon]|nr:hypothetical protein [Candidatus Woesearchaeota archaeon]